MKSRFELTRHLRDRILGDLHTGRLHAGDRLPSIRAVAREVGNNARTIAAAYRALEDEGLIEVRGRSGVFVAHHDTHGAGATHELARWLAGVVTDAWKRRVVIDRLPQLLEHATRCMRLRCGLVEFLEDGIVAFRHELTHDWALHVRVINPDAVGAGGADFADVDFFAATSFCAPQIHQIAESLGKPLVVMTVHPGLQDAVRSCLRDGRLTVVAVDPRSEERIRIAFAGDAKRARIRFVLAHDGDAVSKLDPDEPVLLTRAAHERLSNVPLRMIFPHSPTLSLETAGALANLIVSRNLVA